MARCKGCEHVRGVTLALRTNGRTRSLPTRYCGSKIAISPSFVCQRTFFTLAMHVRSLTNFSFRYFHLLLRPPPQRLTPQKPHLLDDALFGRIGLLEISLTILYRADYRNDSRPKTGVRLENCQKRLVAQLRRRHCC